MKLNFVESFQREMEEGAMPFLQSFSNTEWNKSEDCLPPINTKDEWDAEHQISECVVVWLEGDDSARMGRYHYNPHASHWSIEGYLGFDQSRVKYWKRILSPYK